MRIYVAADHRGIKLKDRLKEWLEENGHEITDKGATTYDASDDYVDFALQAARAVAADPANTFGILICGSGVGMAVAANKVPGIRAAVIHDHSLVKPARNDDHINVIALGADFVSFEAASTIISTALTTPFSEEDRHVRRLSKIAQYEQSAG